MGRSWWIYAIGVLLGVAGIVFFARQGIRDYRVFNLYKPAQCTIVNEDVLTSTMNSGSGSNRRPRTTSLKEYTFQHRLDGTLYTAVGSDNMGGIMGDVGLFGVGKVYPCWYDSADPQEAVLERNFRPLFYLAALLPLAFVLIGGNFLWLALGPKPTIGIAHGGRGDVLPVRLAPELSRGAALGVIAGVLVLWTAGLIAACAWIAMDWGSRLEDWYFFLLIAIGAEVWLVRHAVSSASTMKFADPIVEIDHEPLAPGDKMRISIRQPGPARFDLFRVSLVCERQGGSAKKNQKSILVKKGLELDAATSFTDLVETELSRDAAPSDKTVQSLTSWAIVVKRTKKGALGLDREYPFRVIAR